MALTTTHERRWDAPGALVLNGLAGAFYSVMKEFLGDSIWEIAWDQPAQQKLVLRNSLAHGGSGCFMRILDDGSSAGGGRVARIDVYEQMTDIDTGINPAAGGWIWKAQTATAAACAYTLHSDERTFYATTYVGGDVVPHVTGLTMNNLCCAIGAGDYDPAITGDPGVFAAVSGTENPNQGGGASVGSPIYIGRPTSQIVGSSDHFCVSRNPGLAAIATRATVLAIGISSSSSVSGGPQSLLPDPGAISEYVITPAHFVAGAYRGRLRGLYVINNNTASAGLFRVGTTHAVMGGAEPLDLATLAGSAAGANSTAHIGRMLVARTRSWDQ